MNYKLLLTSLIILLSSTFTLANNDRTGFYVKAGAEGNKLKDAKEIVEIPESSENNVYYLDGDTLVSKSKLSPSYNIGAGYYINDIFRADVDLSYSSITFSDSRGRINLVDQSGDDILMECTFTRKADIFSVLWYGYADFPLTEKINLFAGAGLGIAQIKEKMKQEIRIEINNNYHSTEEESCMTKPKLNLAYSLILGASTKLTDSVHLELSYAWKDYGKTHPKTDEDGELTRDKNHYRGHHVGLGVRYDI